MHHPINWTLHLLFLKSITRIFGYFVKFVVIINIYSLT